MRFRELLLENWSLKLTATFLAFILWLMVRGDPNAERMLSVPLEIRVPRNMEITSERPSSVDVTVRGAFANMWFAPALPTYIVDMQAYDEGDHSVQLSPVNVRFSRASGLEAVAVRPARLKLTLERTIAKEMPIRAQTRGEQGTGVDVYGIVISPPTAVLSGPRSSIERLKEVATEAISIAGQRQSIRSFVNLDIRDDAVHSTPSGPVEVNVLLGPHRKIQKVAGIPIVSDDAKVSVTPRTVTLQVLVPVTYGKPLTPADFLVTAASSSMDPAATSAKIRPEIRLKTPLDPGILIKNVQPSEVTIQRIKKT